MTDECCGNPSCDGCTCREEPEPITEDEARAQVASAVMGSLRKSMDEIEMMTTDAKPGVDKENGEKVLAAAKELYSLLYARRKVFGRPRILRPERSIKVVRG